MRDASGMGELLEKPVAAFIHYPSGHRQRRDGHIFQSALHIADPHRQTQSAARFTVSQFARGVVANPCHCRQCGVVAGKPRVHGVVGGTGFAINIVAL